MCKYFEMLYLNFDYIIIIQSVLLLFGFGLIKDSYLQNLQIAFNLLALFWRPGACLRGGDSDPNVFVYIIVLTNDCRK